MELGQKFETNDPAQILNRESGQFRVWGPSGQVDLYNCQPGGSIHSITHLETKPPRSNYLVEKIANTVGAPLKSAAAGGSGD